MALAMPHVLHARILTLQSNRMDTCDCLSSCCMWLYWTYCTGTVACSPLCHVYCHCDLYLICMVAWPSGNTVGYIISLSHAEFRWSVVSILSRYVTSHSGKLSLLSSVGWEMSTGQEAVLSDWEGKCRYVITDCGIHPWLTASSTLWLSAVHYRMMAK